MKVGNWERGMRSFGKLERKRSLLAFGTMLSEQRFFSKKARGR